MELVHSQVQELAAALDSGWSYSGFFVPADRGFHVFRCLEAEAGSGEPWTSHVGGLVEFRVPGWGGVAPASLQSLPEKKSICCIECVSRSLVLGSAQPCCRPWRKDTSPRQRRSKKNHGGRCFPPAKWI